MFSNRQREILFGIIFNSWARIPVILGLLFAIQVVPKAQAANECGYLSTFTARYPVHTTSPTTPYSQGDIVSTGTGGSFRLWQAGSGTISGVPGSGADMGWTDVTIQYASHSVLCNNLETPPLDENTDILYRFENLAILYRGTQTGGMGSVNSISGRSLTSEIHILSGSVERADDGTSTEGSAVSIRKGSQRSVRITTARGTLVSNADPTSGSHALFAADNAGGDIYMTLAGSAQAAAATTGDGNAAVYARGLGDWSNIRIDVTGGSYSASGAGQAASVIFATLYDSNTAAPGGRVGSVTIDISGSTQIRHAFSTVLLGRGSTAPVIQVIGRRGDDSVTIGSGVLLCRRVGGSSSQPNCDIPTDRADAIRFRKQANAAGGRAVLSNAGTIYGDVVIGVNIPQATVTNQNGGLMYSRLFSTGNRSADTVQNAGTWWLLGDSNFGDGIDSFTNTGSGTLVIRYASTTVDLNNLESFVLQAASGMETGGILRFSVPSAFSLSGRPLLGIGDAIPTLSGIIDFVGRDTTQLLTLGSVPLIRGTRLTSATDISGLSLSDSLRRAAPDARLLAHRGDLLLIFGEVCGPPQQHTPTHKRVICDSEDAQLSLGSDIEYHDNGLSVVYDHPETINSIKHTGSGGEIHVLRGHVRRLNDDSSMPGIAVHLQSLASSTEDIRVVTAPGTSIMSTDASGGSAAILAYGGQGNVTVELSGSTFSSGFIGTNVAVGTGGAGDVDIDIFGGTHEGVGVGAAVLLAAIRTEGTGSIHVDISGNTRLLATGKQHASVILVEGGPGIDTVNIGSGAIICAGSLSEVGLCTPTPAGSSIVVANPLDNTGSPTRIINAGSLTGSIMSIRNTRGTVIRNNGEIFGAFVAAHGAVGVQDGDDVITNTGVWIMPQKSLFGDGDDSFTNRGVLIFRYGGTPIGVENLETFMQTTDATLRIEIDPRRFGPDRDADGRPDLGEPALPSGAILDFGSARGVLEGSLQVVLLDTTGMRGTLTREQLTALVTALEDTVIPLNLPAPHLDISRLALAVGVTKSEDDIIFYDLVQIPLQSLSRITVEILSDSLPDNFLEPSLGSVADAAVAHAYDSVVQASWFAHHAFLDSLVASECAAEEASSQKSVRLLFLEGVCSWMNLSGRLLAHDRVSADIEETVFGISGGFQVPVGTFMGLRWGLSAAAAYEYSDMNMGMATSEGYRGLAGVVLSTMTAEKRLPLNVALGVVVQTGTYEVNRPSAATAIASSPVTGEPQTMSIAGYGGIEYRLARYSLGPLGTWDLLSRLEGSLIGLFVDGFQETLSRHNVKGIEEMLLSLTPCVEARHTYERSWGSLESWVSLGAVAFATDPQLEYTISRDSFTNTFTGTMERFLAEASLGVNLFRNGRSEFSLFWAGIFGTDTLSNDLTLKAKYAF